MFKNNKIVYGFMLSLIVFFSGCSGLSITTPQVKNKESRIIFFVDKSVSEEKLKESLKDAIAYRVDSVVENEGLMPEELPSKPSKPTINEQFKRLMAFAGSNGMSAAMRYKSLDTSNAWYSVGGKGGMTSEYTNKAEYYKAAVYPYKDGYKVYIYQFYTEGSSGIMGNLTNAAVKAIVGNDSALIYMAQVRDKFLKNLPNTKILQQDPSKLRQIKLDGLGWDHGSKNSSKKSK